MKKNEISSEIENITRELVEKYKPEKIILFGSAVKGGDEVNDVDLFIVKEDVPYYGDERQLELYGLLDVNIAVDYIVYKPKEVEERLSLGDPFVRTILKEGKVLYG